MQAVEAAPEDVRSLLLANIVLVGGNCKIPGFHERLSLPNFVIADEIDRGKFDRWHQQITLFDSSHLQSTYPSCITNAIVRLRARGREVQHLHQIKNSIRQNQ